MGSAHYTPVSSLRLLDFRPASYTEVLMRLIGLAAVLAIGLFVAPLAAEAHSAQADVTQAAARALGLKVHVLSVSRADEFPGAFDAARKAHAEALVVLASSFFQRTPPAAGGPRRAESVDRCVRTQRVPRRGRLNVLRP